MTSLRCYVFASIALFLTIYGTANADVNDGLVANWPLDGDAADVSGNAYDGEVEGAILTTDRFGNPESAYFFDGDNLDRILIPNYPALSPAHLSLTAWVRPNASNRSANVIVENWYHSPYGGYSFWLRNPQKTLGFQLLREQGDFDSLEIDFDFDDVSGTWYFLVATYDGEYMRLYVDGVLQPTQLKNTLGYRASSYERMTIGTNPGDSGNGQRFAGSIDDVRIYSRSLSADEIQQLFLGATDSDIDGFLACDDDVCNDCDDTDSTINPDAYEVPGNFVDENCDGNFGDCDPCLDWKNHGHYVRCVAHAAEDLVYGGNITEEEGDAMVTSGAQTDIGKKSYIPQDCE